MMFLSFDGVALEWEGPEEEQGMNETAPEVISRFERRQAIVLSSVAAGACQAAFQGEEGRTHSSHCPILSNKAKTTTSAQPLLPAPQNLNRTSNTAPRKPSAPPQHPAQPKTAHIANTSPGSTLKFTPLTSSLATKSFLLHLRTNPGIGIGIASGITSGGTGATMVRLSTCTA